jgi:hypothetical protein
MNDQVNCPKTVDVPDGDILPLYEQCHYCGTMLQFDFVSWHKPLKVSVMNHA